MTRKLRARLGLIAAGAFAAGPAMAALTIYSRVGVWDAFNGTSDNGETVCGVGTTDATEGKVLSLRWQVGGTQVLFRARKPSWNIPDGTKITVLMQVDRNTPWILQGAGGGMTVSWTLNGDSIQPFEQQFRRGATLTLNFPSGNEPPWTLSLRGSTAASDLFGRCITELTRQGKAR